MAAFHEYTFIFDDSGITQLVGTEDSWGGTQTVTTSGSKMDFGNYNLATLEYTLASGYKLVSITDSLSLLTFDTSSNPIIVNGRPDNYIGTITITTERTIYKKISYDGKKVQVDSAIRDGAGRNISNNYVRTVNNVAPTDGNVNVVTGDTKVNVTLGTTTKAYILGTSTTPTSTATATESVADTGVYLDTTAGMLTATTFNGALTGNSTTATSLQSARSIDGVSFNGSADITHYGVCDTASSTAAKTVSVTGFALLTGSVISIKFTNANTASSSTLNVSSTGAKSIFYHGSAIPANLIRAGGVYTFIYDGTQYNLAGYDNIDTTDVYIEED